MTAPTVVLVPGLRGHVEDHWQTHLAASLPNARHVPPLGRENPVLDERVAQLDQVLREVEGPVVLVAHSAGVLLTVHWAARHGDRPIAGALLTTPPTLASELPSEYPSIAALRENGWLPIPRQPLPFPSVVATSSNDPLANPVRLEALAEAWGSRVHDLGEVGHLNPASGYGPWAGAVPLIDELVVGPHYPRRGMNAAAADTPVSGGSAMLAADDSPQLVTTEEQSRTRYWPGVLAAALGLLGAVLAHRFVPAVGILTWAVALGIAATNLRVLPAAARPGLGKLTRRLLRVGVVLLGFTVSVQSIAALGLGTIALVAVSLFGTLVFTTWLGNRLKLGRARSLLIGTGFAICGASAIAAMQEAAGADEDDVAVGIAMVTLFGTVAMVLLPVLADPLGLTDVQLGIWAGASIHEVGQVVAAAGTAGASVVAVAVVVKLLRVLLLAPVVATVSIYRRVAAAEGASAGRRPPIVPLFVLGFLACAALRSFGLVPAQALSVISHLQVGALGIALFGMGAAVRLSTLFRRSGPVLLVATVSTVFIAGVSLGGIHLLGLG